MDKITVVCHKDHDKGYEDYAGKCLLCVVEDLMREVGRLTAVCKEKEWVGLTDAQVEEIAKYHGIDGLYETSRIDFYRAIEITLKEKNT